MNGLDFGKLTRLPAAERATEPRRIFSALPAKSSKYGYPRDVQSDVWEQWHARRAESDLVIKMNTGSGKTVVGLIMLKSCLNEGVQPVVYVTPDIYLADQVRAEAKELGIETTHDPKSGRFLTGRAILVVNIYKVVNGLSQFGVEGSGRQPVDLGPVLIDDAHACLATVQEQFSLKIDNRNDAYKDLLALFEEDLKNQSKPQLLDIQAGVPSAALRIPWWAWADRQDHVLQVLHPHRDDDDFKFVWPLISEALPLCAAAVTTHSFEIAPPCPPIRRIPSFSGSRRRIYLTATLADDSVLMTHFGADPDGIAVPVTPKSADDLGDRMILTPLETHPGTSDERVRDFLVEQAQHHNVVVIVPSKRRASEWTHVAHAVHDAATIHSGIEALRSNHVGLVVLINKYDGIDLPGDACRVLALDGLPEAYGALDRLEALALQDSEAMVVRQVQRIEQGMGRGVRSNDDYCVVLLLGSRLTQRLHAPGAVARFSPATRAQIRLSAEVAEMLHGRPFSDLTGVIAQCLDRDPDWVAASRDALDDVRYSTTTNLSSAAIAQRVAFDLALLGRYTEAADAMQAAIDRTSERRLRGWLKQQAAAYRHFVDPVAAQQLQTSAQKDNASLLKPRAGVAYARLPSTLNQATSAATHLSQPYVSGPELVVGLSAILDDLVPHPETTQRFEQAFTDLGHHLGFEANRPERDTGEGPDVLWLLGELRFLVIECKSGGTTNFISRHDAAQLSHSMDWFGEEYDNTCKATPILVHKASRLHTKAVARQGARVITFERLTELRGVVRKYAGALAQEERYRDPTAVAAQLSALNLSGKGFDTQWSERTKKT